MASPTNSYYYGASGQPIYGGRTGRPSWRTAMAINTWSQIPGNTLSSIDPAANAAINPNYPGAAPWHAADGQAGVIVPWCGGCWDDSTGSMWLPLGGGHSDYAGNEPYRHSVYQATPAWAMLRNPSGAIGNTITLNDGQEATGLYSDGRLRAVHSYNNNVFVPGLGPVIAKGIGCYISGQSGFDRAYLLNQSTGEASLICDYSGFSYLGTNSGWCYDSSRNYLWCLPGQDAKHMYIDLSTNTAHQVGVDNNYAGEYVNICYLPQYDLIAVMQTGGTGYPQVFYLLDTLSGTPTMIQPTMIGAWSAGFQTSLLGENGMAWDGTSLLLWDNASNTTEISTMTPSGNPRTQSWTKGVMPVSGSNTVTPSVRQTDGTYGRFAYSQKLGGCYLLNNVTEQAYFYATE